jgi:predicted PurR-regulated permease PerM
MDDTTKSPDFSEESVPPRAAVSNAPADSSGAPSDEQAPTNAAMSPDTNAATNHSAAFPSAPSTQQTDCAPRSSLRKRIGRWFLIVVAVGAICWLFWQARAALLPFEIGLLIAYLIFPLVNRMEKVLPRWVAILVIYLGGILILIGSAAYIVPLLWIQATQLLNIIPEMDMHEVMLYIEDVFGEYQRLVPEELRSVVEEGANTTYERIKENIASYAQEVGTFLIGSVMQVVNTVIFLFGFFIVPIWLFYVMSDYRKSYQAINTLLPKNVRQDFWAIVKIIDRVLSSYIRGQIILGVIVGLAAGIGLWVLNLLGFKIKNILLLAVLAGLMEFIPYVGPLIGAIPAVTVGFLHAPTTALAVAILYLAIQILENMFLVPRIIGDSVDIHPAVLIVLMIVFGQVFGFIGILLVAPVSAVSRDVFCYVYGRLGDEPAPAGVLPDSIPTPLGEE